MATGQEHFREAERLLAEGIQVGYDQGPDCGGAEVLAAALVHATLAHTLATALAPFADDGVMRGQTVEWMRASGQLEAVQPSQPEHCPSCNGVTRGGYGICANPWHNADEAEPEPETGVPATPACRAAMATAADWDEVATARMFRASQLGDCRTGLALASEAGIFRQCANELRAALTDPAGVLGE